MDLSVNVELLFTEAGDQTADRIRAAADAGITTVEIWSHSDKDLTAIRSAADAAGSRVWTLLIEGRAALADRETHKGFVEEVRRACQAAREIGCERIVTGSGIGFPFMKRAVAHAAVVDALKAGADVAADHGVTILLENLNTRVDHPGTLFDDTVECLDAVREVDSPAVALLYDVYHSLQMRETPTEVLTGAIDLVSHVQIAEPPDRHEPGSAGVDWATQLGDIKALGYTGPIGLEYWPTTASLASVAPIAAIVDAL